MIVDSKTTILKLAQFQVCATGALKFNTPMEHKVRNGKILTFTSFSITQRKKLTFYVNGLSGYARMMHRKKAYGMLIPKIKFLGRGIFELLLQQPLYSIEHKVRNSIILTFTSSITQLENMLFTSTDCLVMQE